jgi:dephospho-CoA kinase
MAKVIGLTGSFGTGKTFAASVFRSLGARVLDADLIARSVTARGKPAYRKIVSAFGPAVLGRAREIDRGKLAGIVFADRKSLERLNRITHPEIIKIIKRGIGRSGLHDVVVVDAPLLIEAGLAGMADIVIVVTAPRHIQIARCMKKFNIERGGVIRRISSQIPVKKKIKIADFVVDNGGSKTETRRQIMRIWKETVWR